MDVRAGSSVVRTIQIRWQLMKRTDPSSWGSVLHVGNWVSSIKTRGGNASLTTAETGDSDGLYPAEPGKVFSLDQINTITNLVDG